MIEWIRAAFYVVSGVFCWVVLRELRTLEAEVKEVKAHALEAINGATATLKVLAIQERNLESTTREVKFLRDAVRELRGIGGAVRDRPPPPTPFGPRCGSNLAAGLSRVCTPR